VLVCCGCFCGWFCFDISSLIIIMVVWCLFSSWMIHSRIVLKFPRSRFLCFARSLSTSTFAMVRYPSAK